MKNAPSGMLTLVEINSPVSRLLVIGATGTVEVKLSSGNSMVSEGAEKDAAERRPSVTLMTQSAVSSGRLASV
jgi:hypothetical protein